MKILIEENVKTYINGTVRLYYRVKYNRGFWWPFWQYLRSKTDDSIQEFDNLDEAKRVANKLSEEFVGPKHEITDLDLDGYPVYKYHGG